MAKKDKKAKGKKASGKPQDALRDAVERTFGELPGGAQKRLQDLVEEVNSAVTRLREQKFTETLDALRDQVEGLGRRVSALEKRDPMAVASEVADAARNVANIAQGKKPAARKAAAKRRPGARKAAAKRKPAAKKAAAKKAAPKRGAAKKSAAKRKAAAKKSPASKPAAAS